MSYRIDDDPSPSVQAFYESSDGAYWVSTDEGLYRVHRNTEPSVEATAQSRLPGIRNLRARKVADVTLFAIFEDSRGRLWGGTGGGLVSIENREADRVDVNPVEFSRNAADQRRSAVRGFAEASDGSLWLVCNAGAARLLPDGRWIEYFLPRVSEYEDGYNIRIAHDGLVWVTHTTGVYILRPEPAESFANRDGSQQAFPPITTAELGIVGKLSPPKESGRFVRLRFAADEDGIEAGQRVDSKVRDILAASDGKVWVPSATSLYVFDEAGYVRLRDANARPGRSTSIAEDGFGNVWFGTFGGVVKYVRNGLISYDQADGMAEPSIHSIAETMGGQVLAVHGTWLVSLIRPEGIRTARLNLPADSRFTWTSRPVFLDGRGAIWALSDQALYRFPPGSGFDLLEKVRPEIISDARSTGNFWYRAFDGKNGIIWFATRNRKENNFLFRYDSVTSEWIDYSAMSGFPRGTPVASFAEDRAGNQWFGFYGSDGIVRFREGRFTRFSVSEGFPPGAAMDMLVDEAGRLWITSTESGVVVVDDPAAANPVFRRYSETEGLANNNVRCLTDDASGNIYAGTVRGVSRIEPATGRIKNITTDDGLAADFVQSAFRSSGGSLWFGTANGLSRLDPRPETARPSPQILIDGLTIAGTSFGLSEFGQQFVKDLDLSAAQNNLQIDFFSIGDRENITYQYRLDGAGENDWRDLGGQRSVTFANLSAGDYRLELRAIDRLAGASPNPAIVAFRINPAFYRTWWFLLLAMFFVAAAVLALDRYRVSKTRQVESALVLSRESETRFRTLADTASDAILTVDDESRIVFANEAVQRVFGYMAADVVGRNLITLVPEYARPEHEAMFKRLLRASEKRSNWDSVAISGLHKSGHEIPLEVSFGSFERNGRRYFTGIARDVTERKRAEEDLRQAREEKFRELERVRTRIATDLHDDIGSSLTQISVYSELARQLELENEAAGEPLDMISNISNELVDTMSDIVWAINPKKDHLLDLTQRMRRFAANVLSARDIVMRFTAPDSDLDLPLGANIRREVFLIFKETVSNIVKHSFAVNAEIDFRIDKHWLEIRFRDDGKGFDQSNVRPDDWRTFRGGNGLLNMHKRAADLGGSYQVLSEAGKGTTVVLRVPLEVSQEKTIG